MITTFIEQECTIEHDGQSFISGGGYIVNCEDGIARGAIYVNEAFMIVTKWDGSTIAKLDTCTDYQGNFCKMRRITFTYQGIKFVGDYCPEWADICKVHSTKKERLT